MGIEKGQGWRRTVTGGLIPEMGSPAMGRRDLVHWRGRPALAGGVPVPKELCRTPALGGNAPWRTLPRRTLLSGGKPLARPQPPPRPRAAPGQCGRRQRQPFTCGVPNGDVEGAPLLQVEGAAHRADRVREAPLHVPLQQRRLSHVHVPQKHDLPVGLPHLPTRRLPATPRARAPGSNRPPPAIPLEPRSPRP